MRPSGAIIGMLALAVVLAPGLSGQRPQAGAVRVHTLSGLPVDPLTFPQDVKAAVYLFVSVDCPISNRYAPEIRRLHQRFATDGVRFTMVYPNPAERVDVIAEHRHAYGFPGDAVRDPAHSLVTHGGITMTPEAAVFTPDGALAYRGRIDDRYVNIGIERPAATRHDLADALSDLLAGQPVREPRTEAVGCYVADFAR